MVDEVEHPVICPMEVLEHEDERALLGQCLDEAPPGGKRLLTRVGPARCALPDSDQLPQMPKHPVCVRVVRQCCRDGLGELALRDVAAVRVEYAGLRLYDLGESPEAHALAVRQ